MLYGMSGLSKVRYPPIYINKFRGSKISWLNLANKGKEFYLFSPLAFSLSLSGFFFFNNKKKILSTAKTTTYKSQFEIGQS